MITEEIRRWIETPPKVRGMRYVEDMFVIGTDIGKSRDENQDRVAILKVGSQRSSVWWCACLCDGMGGMKNGSEAASLAIAAFFSSLVANRRLEPILRLQAAAREASEEVYRELPGGGATLSAILIDEAGTFTINVGDSRIYQLTHEKEIERLTVDDTLEEAFGGEGRGLLQYIGSKSKITPHIAQLTEKRGEILITSDGAHVVGDKLLQEIGRHAENPLTHCERILDLANWIGGRDNATVISALSTPTSSSQVSHTSSGISVWGVDGKLKITWAPAPIKTDGSRQIAEQTTAEAQPQDEVKEHVSQKSSQGKTTKEPRRRKSSKKKLEDVEIGFFDEGADTNDNS